MKITYDGPRDAVDVHIGGGEYRLVVPGGELDASASVCARLLASGEWSEAAPNPKKKG